MMKSRWLFLFAFLIFGVVLWWNSTKKDLVILFEVPNDFEGPFAVLEDSSQNEPREISDGTYQIKIPENGLVLVKDLSIFLSWHKEECQRENGQSIPRVFVSEGMKITEESIVNLGSFGDAQERFLLYVIANSKNEFDEAFKRRPFFCLGVPIDEQKEKKMLPFYYHNRSGSGVCNCPVLED